MYVEWIELENVMCFEKARLDFSLDGKMLKWNLLLGENGTGKSTILKLIAFLLMRDKYHYHLMPDPLRIVRDGTSDAVATLGVKTRIEGKWRSCHIEYVVNKLQGGSFKESFEATPRKVYNTLYDSPPFVVGYGATRLMTKETSVARDDTRVETLFIEGKSLEPIEEWLKNLAWKGYKEQTSQEERYRMVTELMSDIIPGVTFKEVNADGEAVFSTPYGYTRFADMSRGYQDVLTWVCDLLRKLLEFAGPRSNIFKIPGVVLVEEIALHLHPSWQRKVISYVRNNFPELQFIATTHSPLAAQSVDRGELVILDRIRKPNRKRDTVNVNRLDIVPKAMTVDQILTSPFFGLDSPSAIETNEKMEQFYSLKRKIVQREASPAEEKEYENLREYLDRIKEAPGMTNRERDLFNLMQDMLVEMGRSDMVDRPTLAQLKRKLDDLGE